MRADDTLWRDKFQPIRAWHLFGSANQRSSIQVSWTALRAEPRHLRVSRHWVLTCRLRPQSGTVRWVPQGRSFRQESLASPFEVGFFGGSDDSIAIVNCRGSCSSWWKTFFWPPPTFCIPGCTGNRTLHSFHYFSYGVYVLIYGKNFPLYNQV